MDDDQYYMKRLDALRKKASGRLANAPLNDSEALGDQTERASQELKIHKIELELQNEELQSAQIKLAQSRDRYLKLYHQSPVGYVVTDAAGIIPHANETFGDMLNQNISVLLQKPLSQFIHPDDRDLFFPRYRPFFKNLLNKRFEIRKC
jgi:PAS domain-containing protein